MSLPEFVGRYENSYICDYLTLNIYETPDLYNDTSGRGEESANSVTIAVYYLLMHLSMSWLGRFMLFSARTQHESIRIV